ncbi:MAG: DUF6531 domain-containing protein, partial [Candidatus Thiodiazotropha sp.]
MMPCATHGDPQLGVDIHLYEVFLPPVPAVPLPTLNISVVFDPFDYIPFPVTTPEFSIMGHDVPSVTLLKPPVEVGGMKRANAGTMGISVHIPSGFPFVPPFPSIDSLLFMGSSSVAADFEPLSYTGVPVLSCQMIGIPSPPRFKKMSLRINLLPTVVNLAIPKRVYVGGSPTISWRVLAFRAGFAALSKLFRKFVTPRIRQALTSLRQSLNRSIRFIKCHVHRGEPVNIITGEVWLEQSDFTLDGRIPIEWIRSYTSNNHRRGAGGMGWETPADSRLEFDPSDGSVVFRYLGDGPAVFLETPGAQGEDAAVMEVMDGALLSDHGDEWRVRTKRDLIYHFPKARSQTTREGLVELPLEQISDLCGNWLKFLREAGQLVAILESAGRYLSFDYTESGYISAINLRVPDSEQVYPYLSCEYTQSGDLSAVKDALG